MSSDNAIERLRELLDERGVHHVGDGDTVRWLGKDGCVCRAYTRAYSRRADLCVDVAITYVPPERAIEATLGDDGATELRAENAKLRELVSFVLRFETMTDGCGDTCPYVCLNCKNECYFRKVAGELRIEVGA